MSVYYKIKQNTELTLLNQNGQQVHLFNLDKDVTKNEKSCLGEVEETLLFTHDWKDYPELIGFEVLKDEVEVVEETYVSREMNKG